MSILQASEGSGVRRSKASRPFWIGDSTGLGFDTGVDDLARIYIDVGGLEISDKFVSINVRGSKAACGGERLG